MLKIMNNKNLYHVYMILNKSYMIYTMIVLYYIEKGLTFTEIMILNSVSAVTSFLLEVPSGIIADLVKRKYLLVFSSTLTLVALSIILVTNQYHYFIIAAIIMGISEAAKSGADSAFIYDDFSMNSYNQSYSDFVQIIYRNAFYATALSAFFSGFFYSINIHLPVIITIFLSFLSLICTLLLTEQKINNNENNSISLINRERDFIHELLHMKDFLKIVFLYVVFTVIISNINFLSQSYLNEIHIPIRFFGVLFLIFNLSSGIGSRRKLLVKISTTKTILLFSFLLMGLSISYKSSIVLLMVFARLISGSIWPKLDLEINTIIPKEKRATLLSYKGLAIQISFIVFDPIIGLLTDYKNIHFTYMIMAICLLISLMIFKLYKHHASKKTVL